jgi:hypothetical protein
MGESYQKLCYEQSHLTICRFLESIKYHNEHISMFGIKTFLELIFYNNIFKYEKNFYLQKVGIAMGCICGPTVANLYLYALEKYWLSINRPLIYKRFIDDIFYLNKGKLDQTDLNLQFENLKLSFLIDKKVPFLDLNVEIDKFRNKIKFSLYIKPTNTFQYLHINSNHPKYIFKNIPKSLFLKVRRICSEDVDYFFHARNLLGQLLKRGYDFDFLLKILCQIGRLDRKSLIAYRDKGNNIDQYSIRLCMGFDHNYLDLKKDTFLNFVSISEQFEWLKSFKLTFTNSILPNFKKLFIDNFHFNFNQNFFTRNCNSSKCIICKFILKDSYLKLKNFILPLKCNSNCKSLGIVYVIKCLKCEVLYIGESEFSASKRISQHLYDIKSFIPYGLHNYKILKIQPKSGNHRPKRLLKSNNFNMCIFKPFKKISEVAEHFNLKGHVKDSHFRYCIFEKNLREKDIRQSVETDLINFVKNFGEIINKKIPNFKFIKKLCFS